MRKFQKPKYEYGMIYRKNAISSQERQEILEYLESVHPIWEERYSKNNPPPEGEAQRTLLRPVYWLGNWQFACLNYYHPPKGIFHRCIRAEPFPAVLQKIVQKIELQVRQRFQEKDVPKNWKLNTCLINYYGSKVVDGKKLDAARVGEHKDFEPGPVASLSIGEKALFQFVVSKKRGTREAVILQQWLEDGTLQIFGGTKFKRDLFHRVQRVDKKLKILFPINGIENFEARRINFTFRYVPEEHICRFRDLPAPLKEDTISYMELLSKTSPFFRKEI